MMEDLDLVVRGQLALAHGLMEGDLGVRGGQIVAIADRATLTGADELDAGPALVLPGVVDMHVHTRSEPEEGIARATLAAAAGGVTTIIDMPYDDPEPVDTPERVARKARAVEREAAVDVALWATISSDNGGAAIPQLVAGGAAGVKVSTFETHPTRFPRIPDGELLLALKGAHAASCVVAFHAETDEIVRRLEREHASAGVHRHALSRPPAAENHAIAGVLELALATGAPVHICHVTTARGVALVRSAASEGADVSCETCTHYLLLDERELERRGGRAKVNPPLRDPDEVDRLWAAVADGAIDAISSDHVGWPLSKKAVPDVTTAKAGFPGLELTLPLLFSEGVVRRALPLQQLLRLLCERPAQRLGLWPRKGTLSLHADADIVVFDPGARWQLEDDALVSSAGWSPYTGWDVTGRVVDVLVRGVLVNSRGRSGAGPGHGRFLCPRDYTRQVASPVGQEEMQ
jgi:allantoinase